MNNKYLRYILGFILLALIITAFYFSGKTLYYVSSFFIIIAMIEYRGMFKNKNIFPPKFIPEVTGILCAYIFSYTHGIEDHAIITPILMGGIILSFITTVILNKKPYLLTALSSIMAILLIFCGLYMIKLTYFFNQYFDWYIICVYIFAVLSGDYMASIIGQKFGKRKLAAEISPNKTVVGAITNVIFSCLSCLLLIKILGFTILQCIMLGIIISVFAQLGDLTISSIKRDLDLKQSSDLFLNYGGILDRMDAFLFSAPAVYYYLFLITVI